MAVSALTEEAASARSLSWIRHHDADTPAISEWVITEFSAAISMKVRNNQLNRDQQAATLMAFDEMIVERLDIFHVTRRHFHVAAGLANQFPTGLRAADALHLAVCRENGATLVTLDKGLAAAGPQLGVATLLL